MAVNKKLDVKKPIAVKAPVTGRSSSTGPNLSNLPKKDEAPPPLLLPEKKAPPPVAPATISFTLPAGVAPILNIDLPVQTLEDLNKSLSGVCDSVVGKLRTCGLDHTKAIPQSVLRVAMLLGLIKKLAEKTAELVESVIKAHKAQNGVFESGGVTVTWPTSAGKRSPKWKEEAIRLGREVFNLRKQIAELTGTPFVHVWNEDLFIEEIQKSYPAQPTESIKITPTTIPG